MGFPGLCAPPSLLKKLNSRQIPSVFQTVYINLIPRFMARLPAETWPFALLHVLLWSQQTLLAVWNKPIWEDAACMLGCRGLQWLIKSYGGGHSVLRVELWPRCCSAGCIPPLHHSLIHRAGCLLAADGLL